MKPLLFLLFLIVASTTITVAQSHTRDVLFPHFAEDKAKLDEKEAKSVKPAPKQTRSSKEAIFTNYQAQNATAKARPLAAQSRKASAKLPSDVSGTAKKEKTAPTTAPVTTVPSQGDEPSLKAPAAQPKKN